MDKLDWIAWKVYRLWVWPLRKVGYWTYEHGYKECPSGERFCQHPHYRLGRPQ